MPSNKNTNKKVRNRKFKSLYDVKNTYLPNKDLKFLEGDDTEFSRESFMRIIKKVEHHVEDQPAEKK